MPDNGKPAGIVGLERAAVWTCIVSIAGFTYVELIRPIALLESQFQVLEVRQDALKTVLTSELKRSEESLRSKVVDVSDKHRQQMDYLWEWQRNICTEFREYINRSHGFGRNTETIKCPKPPQPSAEVPFQ